METDPQYQDVLDWLLEPANPAVRYRTLCNIFGMSEDNAEVRSAKAKVPKSGAVVKILSKQHPDGYWGDTDSPYLPKYKATYWNLILLAQMGVTRSGPQIAKACEYIFRFQLEDGGFSVWDEVSAGSQFDQKKASMESRGRKVPDRKEWIRSFIREGEFSCLTGNVCAALLRFGYAKDFRVQRALNWLVEIQHVDGGWKCPYWKAHLKDKHSCFMGTIAALEAFAEVPVGLRSVEMETAIGRGAGFVLLHRLYRADHHDWEIIKPEFAKISFPWFYGYDFLRGLWVLAKLGYVRDARTQDAVDLLMEKRSPDGCWLLEKTPAGRMFVSFGKKGKPNKWTTLLAFEVLVKVGRVRVG